MDRQTDLILDIALHASTEARGTILRIVGTLEDGRDKGLAAVLAAIIVEEFFRSAMKITGQEDYFEKARTMVAKIYDDQAQRYVAKGKRDFDGKTG